ncbi:MAG: DUF1444 family protein [Phycisphaerae bacterium]|nr:DUF1444 family protein [Phycisphaerae bacterium]MDW8263581.1 DUF1444 family protein [Phycisphaerales bacterium]
MTREQFFEQVMRIIRARFPLVQLSRGDDSFSMRMNGHVASLENLYRVALLRPEETQRHVERWALELLRAAEGSPDQSAGYDDVKDRILPLLIGSTPEVQSAAGSMVFQPLVAGLSVAYVIDSERAMSYIPPATLQRWGIDLDQLHERAISNLVARSEQLAAHAAADPQGQINLILFQTMDGYDATRLLLPTLHDRLREHLGSPFVAGVPNRDILLCFRNDADTVGRLRGQIGLDFRSMPNSITDRLLLVTADGIAPYS